MLGGSLLFGFLWQLSLNPQLFLPGVFCYIWRALSLRHHAAGAAGDVTMFQPNGDQPNRKRWASRM
ncbi:MAG: hypothetical protein M9927_07700 [Anaerolineae bacterium]|nr:hypothetical protein [Anaerolineae bacterium]